MDIEVDVLQGVESSGVRGYGLVFGVWCLVFGVWCLRVGVDGFGFRVCLVYGKGVS